MPYPRPRGAFPFGGLIKVLDTPETTPELREDQRYGHAIQEVSPGLFTIRLFSGKIALRTEAQIVRRRIGPFSY